MNQTSDDSSISQSSDIVAQLADFARSLRDLRRSMPQTLDEIPTSATPLIDHADTGAIAIATVDRGVQTIVASTSELAEKLCRRQYEMGEGPILSEVRHLDVVADDLDDEARWPHFASAAVDEGIRSPAAFQLYSNGDDVGALVLFSTTTRAFDTDAVVVGEALAAHAAIAMLGVRDDEQFRAGLASRDIIGQAKGMIMERYDVDAVQAFEWLATLSQQQNIPLRAIAQSLVDADHPTTPRTSTT